MFDQNELKALIKNLEASLVDEAKQDQTFDEFILEFIEGLEKELILAGKDEDYILMVFTIIDAAFVEYLKAIEADKKQKQWIKEGYPNISDRMASQIAISLTGLYLFQEIVGTELKIPYDRLNTYINSCLSRFKLAQNPLDKLMNAFLTLAWEKRIYWNAAYTVEKEQDGSIILKFHKTAVVRAYNRYYTEDKSDWIKPNSIKEIDTDEYKILTFNDSVDIKGKKVHGLKLDITNHPDAEGILKTRLGWSTGVDSF